MAEQARSCFMCGGKTTSMFHLPKDEDLKKKWLEFIFGSIPTSYPKSLVVCANHFQDSDFANLGAYNSGYASKLVMKPGSSPSVRSTTTSQAGSSTAQASLSRPSYHASTQTEPPPPPPRRPTRCTQLSEGTLHIRHYRSKETQCHFSDTKKSVQTNTDAPSLGPSTSTPSLGPSTSTPSTTPIKSGPRPNKRPRLEEEEEEEEESIAAPPDPLDKTYDPEQSMTTVGESSHLSGTSSTSSPGYNDNKYIVFEKNLMELFEKCPNCRRAAEVKTFRRGTFLSVDQRCHHCNFIKHWESQPLMGSSPVGNLQLSAAVYCTGSSFNQVQKVFKAMRLRNISYSSFRRHATRYIEPAVIHKWHQYQDGELESLRHQKLKLGGDMRADSPGHCAKYGTYSLMNMENNKIIALQLVQSNEVGGSHNMEKEGLIRGLQLLDSKGMTVDYIVTDRHPQIQKFLREKKITHYFDVWHLEKGLSKKVSKVAKEKDCEVIQKWQRGISNHVYWCATSSTSGSEKVAKWTSLFNHMQDQHVHENPEFPKCLHAERKSNAKKKWLKPGSKALLKMEKVLVNKRVLGDVERLSSRYQTSTLEAFHSVILRFTPKNVVFPFIGMLCRQYLAALHFNENSNRTQAKTTAGTLKYSIHFPKAKKGGYTVKPMKSQATQGYVQELISLLFEDVIPRPQPYQEELRKIPVPANLSAAFHHPPVAEAVAAYQSRFKKGQP
ncbi:uncharacterized protein LOC134449779 [Engraulis encrasicolus]|uniref:uncharacterized protein LOC134449779 n=1 Tax=Engraulis encrasicolus TaxID=184585 RepID=UPI002FD446B9